MRFTPAGACRSLLSFGISCANQDRDAERNRTLAAELVALAPDVILAHSSAAVAPLLRQTRSIRIVFTVVADAVGAGYVDSMARPGGNASKS